MAYDHTDNRLLSAQRIGDTRSWNPVILCKQRILNTMALESLTENYCGYLLCGPSV
jgi:hypothetical protein